MRQNRPMSIGTHDPLSVAARPELTGDRSIGVLVCHGFTGSPASMRPWATALAERGFAVEMPRLPGHGTTWQEMNKTGWADWYAEAARAFERLCAANDTVVLAGLSMGGALMLRLAADHPDRVAGVVVVNPAVATERKDVLALPLLKHVIGSFPAIGNDIKKPGVDEHAYPKTPLRAAASMMAAWKPLRADLVRVTAPLLYFKSATDHVVDPSSQKIILGSVASPDVELRMLEESYHVATLDNDAPLIFEESIAFIERVAGLADATS